MQKRTEVFRCLRQKHEIKRAGYVLSNILKNIRKNLKSSYLFAAMSVTRLSFSEFVDSGRVLWPTSMVNGAR